MSEATNNSEYELKEGQLMIFKNTRKEDDKQPDFWGKCMIDGVEKRIGLWKNVSTNGGNYLNGSIRDYVPNGTPSTPSGDDFDME